MLCVVNVVIAMVISVDIGTHNIIPNHNSLIFEKRCYHGMILTNTIFL